MHPRSQRHRSDETCLDRQQQQHRMNKDSLLQKSIKLKTNFLCPSSASSFIFDTNLTQTTKTSTNNSQEYKKKDKPIHYKEALMTEYFTHQETQTKKIQKSQNDTKWNVSQTDSSTGNDHFLTVVVADPRKGENERNHMERRRSSSCCCLDDEATASYNSPRHRKFRRHSYL